MPVEARLPRGMRDILPQQMIKRQYVIRRVEEVFEEFGFEPIQTPALERAETLTGKYGPDAEKLIYHASHPGGKENLALRYDLSVPLCRLVGLHRQLHFPFKRYHIAPVWRAERPQRGRYREFYQCDVDIVGCRGLLADAEIMNVIYKVLHRLGFQDFCIHFNSRRILNGIGQYSGVAEDQLGSLYRSIDKMDKIGVEGVEAELRKNGIEPDVCRRLIDLLEIEGENQELLKRLEKVLVQHDEARQGLSDLAEIIDYLEAMGVPKRHYSVKFAMVRGLDYYTGSIYETTIRNPPMPSITGGGRYDRLIGMFRKDSLPAVGTSLGIERIIDAMEELNMFPEGVGGTVVQALVSLFSPQLAVQSLQLAERLRAAGIRTELFFDSTSLKSQFKYANRKGIPYVLVLGPDEAARNQVTLRDFTSGRQEAVDQTRAADLLKAWISER